MEAGSMERSRVPERLQRRDEERQRELEKKRQVKEEQVVLEEKSGYFVASFGQERAAIEEALNGGEVGPQLLEEVSGRIQGLQKLLNDSIMFLPSYDTRQAQEHIGRLQSSLDARRLQLQPKKKFTFTSRKKETTTPAVIQPNKEVPAQPAVEEMAPCGFRGLTGQVLSLSSEEIRQKNVQLSQLRDCTVTLPGSPATLHMRDLKGCRVLCGPVSSSVFVDDCHQCLFAIPCQQLRTHSTRDCRFYLHVTSRAIIEDCSEVTFAPFTWSYPEMLEDYQVSGLDRNRNNWDQVDDFNWLARDAKSPNWAVIPEEERITQWN